MKWLNVSANTPEEFSFSLPEIAKPCLAYLRIRTELQVAQIFELVETIRIGRFRSMTGIQWSVYTMLVGVPVKKATAEEAYYFPLHLLPEDGLNLVTLRLDSKMIKNPEISAKLRIAEPPEIVMLPPTGDEKFPEAEGWYVTRPQVAAVQEDLRNLFEVELTTLPNNKDLSQIVFYGHVNSQTWIKKGELWLKDQKIAEFRHPSELTVLDKEVHKMNIPTMPVFTWTFKSWKDGKGAALKLDQYFHTPKLILWLDPKVMPKDAKIQIWSFAAL